MDAPVVHVRKGMLPHMYTLSALPDARTHTLTVSARSTSGSASTDGTDAGFPVGGSPRAAASHPHTQTLTRAAAEASTTYVLDSPRAPRFTSTSRQYPATDDVLTFRTYFLEGAPEGSAEGVRVRLLVLQCFMRDITVELHDPDVRNDGVIHGRFLKRIAVDGINAATYRDVLRVGSNVCVHGRTMRIYACDEHTRTHFEKAGCPQEADQEPPVDVFTASQVRRRPAMRMRLLLLQQCTWIRYIDVQAVTYARQDPALWHGLQTSSITRYLEARVGSQRSFGSDSKGRFLELGDITLRFLLVVFEDGGARIRHRMAYYLASREVEISEERGQRIYEKFMTLVGRNRLPKTYIGHDDRSRSCDTFEYQQDYYNEHDFRVGGTFNIYGRTALIYDCDEFTHQWYLDNLGINQRENAVDLTEPPPPPMEVPIPPYNGFGSEEDTLNSLKSLVPKPRKLTSTLTPAATGRYDAVLESSHPEDAVRRFVVSFYAETSQLSVYEHPVRNSGVLGGPFLRRGQYKHAATGEPLVEADITMDGRVEINSHTFRITGKQSTLASV